MFNFLRNKFTGTQISNFGFNEYWYGIGKRIIKKFRKKTPADPQYKDRPTFKEFVDSVLNTKVKSMNAHWKPINDLCMPCYISYDIIGRYKSFKIQQ